MKTKRIIAALLALCLLMGALAGCSSKNAESSKPSIHIESYTKVGYDTVTVQSGDISPILNLKLSPDEFEKLSDAIAALIGLLFFCF